MNGQDSLNDFAKHVNGLDLYNEKGALTYLKKIVSLALKIAHENGSPGIFIDPEAYNCYDAYSITELAKRHGKSTTEIVSRLKDIGGEIADASSPIFPNAVFFFYIIDFGNEMADGFERSFVYIAEGILERAIKGSYELKVVDGWTGKYLYTSVADMEFQVNQALARKAPYLEKYPNLEISGVVAPFDSFDKLKYNSWIKKGLLSAYVQDRLEVQSSADFKPIYQYLFNNLKWVWVYGATEAMGSIFQGPELSPKFVKVIGDTIPTIKRLPREPVILKIN